MTEEVRLCHFLQFAGDFFFPLRGKTDLYRRVIFAKIIKMTRGGDTMLKAVKSAAAVSSLSIFGASLF